MGKFILLAAGTVAFTLFCFPANAQIPDPTDTIALTSAAPYYATGLVYIAKADTNAPGLRNPVLVAEGFDINNTMDWELLYELMNREQLAEEVMAFGRDLIILNFGDSTDDILANCALTETAIEFVNANRHDPNDKFTAIGVSLGGLTMRKALATMPNHDVDTWISFDAPHEGGNLPLGLQEYIEFFAGYDDSAAEYLVLLDRPASKQLLLTHHTHSPDAPAGPSAPEFADFMAAMDAAGYPTNCKTVAISNGSGFGEKLPFNPGELIIHWTDSGFLKPTVAADIHALPQTASAKVFYGSVTVFFVTDTTTVDSYLPYSLDNAPGGYRNTFYEFFTNIPPDSISGDDYLTATNHCFVPTVSALGIPVDHIETNLADNSTLLALSPFDEIHFAPANEEHVEINLNNKRWIMRSVLEGRDSDGDGWDDYQEYLIGSDYASADSGLAIELAMEAQSAGGSVRVVWSAYPNTRYDVWYTDELGSPWNLIDTIPPGDLSGITNEYVFATTSTPGFFAVSGMPVDPVTD